jgi:glycosyltransferase involved in cell wall biosynthesis
MMSGGYGNSFDRMAIALFRHSEIELMISDNGCKPDLQIFYGQPFGEYLQRYYERKADLSLIFTMFETPILPEDWVENINGLFDGLITPSQWCADIFRNEGVEKPIHIVPLGVDCRTHFYLRRPERKSFTVLWQGMSFGDRKGGEIVLRAFKALHLPDSRLILKTHPGGGKHRGIAELSWPIEGTLGVRAIRRNLTPAEMVELLWQADFSCNPTAGEGFGLIPLEHMATGLPVAVSDNTGCKDFINDGYNLRIECQPGPSPFGSEYGESSLPDYRSVCNAIEWAYHNRKQAYAMGSRAANWVEQRWTYKRTVEKLVEVLKKYVS